MVVACLVVGFTTTAGEARAGGPAEPSPQPLWRAYPLNQAGTRSGGSSPAGAPTKQQGGGRAKPTSSPRRAPAKGGGQTSLSALEVAGIALGGALLLVLAVGVLAWSRQGRLVGERPHLLRPPAVRVPRPLLRVRPGLSGVVRRASAASRRLADAPRPAFAAAARAAASAGGSARLLRDSARHAGRGLAKRRGDSVEAVRDLRPAPREEPTTRVEEPKRPAEATSSDDGAPRPDVVGDLLGTLSTLRADPRAAEAAPDSAARRSQPRVARKPPAAKPLDGGRVGVEALKAKQTRGAPSAKGAPDAHDDVTLLKTKLAQDTAPDEADAETLKAKLGAAASRPKEDMTAAERRATATPVVKPLDPPPAEEAAAAPSTPQRVRARRAAAASQACRIALWHGYVNSRFCALVETQGGEERVIAESPEFRWWKSEPPPRERADVEAAYRALVGKLESDGWAAAGEGGQWFELRLRRQAPPQEVPPPSVSPPNAEALLLLALGRRRPSDRGKGGTK